MASVARLERMALDLQTLAVEKAELLSGRLRELLSFGQGHIRAQFGLDLGLKPELYPTWVVLCTAAAGLLLLLGLSWSALCGGLFARKKRGSSVTQAHITRAAKPEEPKKRNKKKTSEKKAQSNGQPGTEAQEDVNVIEAVTEPSTEIRTGKVHVVQAPMQVKKNKKKAKADAKQVQRVSTTDGKEPDDGTWETKVSNREKKQQRRKDKGPEDSGSPGVVDFPKSHAEAPVAPATSSTRKNRGNYEPLHPRNNGKVEAGSGPVSTSWREEPSVNGRAWADISTKIPAQIGNMEGDVKWSTISSAPRHRAQPERQSWGQETQATWSGIDGRVKTELNPVSFSMLGMNTTEPLSKSCHCDVDDEWTGFNGMAAVDSSSDWNAPVEHWGNYEEAPVLVTPAPPPKEQPVPNKVSDDEKEIEDPAGGAAKPKKKKKKKKKAEEEAAPVALMVNSVPHVNPIPKPQELPVVASNKQSSNIPSSQKKSEPVVEPPKPLQKKKVRKET